MNRKTSLFAGAFTGGLLLTFIVLNLSGAINWPWWWEESMLWGNVKMMLLVGLVYGMAYGSFSMLACERRSE